MCSYEREVKRLERLADEVNSDELSQLTESDNESLADEDHNLVSDHELDTEQESFSDVEEQANLLRRSRYIKISTTTTETNTTEIMALLGLLYLAGSQHGGRKHIAEFYSDDGLGCEIFPAAMAQRRVKFLLRCLRFDDTNTREVRKSQDNLAAVREMMIKFNEQCKVHYSVGEYVTLDEMLLAFRGRCRFKMYIPNKPNKYGLKVFSMVDSRTFYTSHLEIYAGTQLEGPFKIDNSTAAVTERMCMHLSGSGRNVTMDRWFTGYKIASLLLREHRLTVVATIRANRRSSIVMPVLERKWLPRHV
ncbi:piggyBac transposable element-derived protein 4-like [Onthophagus taurus]|uniref:piggyBac transposable element-derived protein 4-like n=1 Tax=Onthophagus taurus TaxID=166361 RepID=UPI0039BE68D3